MQVLSRLNNQTFVCNAKCNMKMFALDQTRKAIIDLDTKLREAVKQ